MDDVDRLLSRVKRSANGKLPLRVYRRLYDSAAARGGGTLVEIGTAQGAATIALALGATASGADFRILTVDAFVTGSRPRGASVEEKCGIVRRGFESFGISARVDLIAGTTADLIAIADPRDIGLLLLDADGRIDRDLALLYARLRPDCTIVIDDVDDNNYLYWHKRRLRFDQKHRLTYLLAERFTAAGLLAPDESAGQTRWYRKGAAAPGGAEIELLALPCYRELVFADIDGRVLSVRRALFGLAASRAPWLLRAWRKLRPER